MGEFIKETFAVLFLVYFAVCGVFVPIFVYAKWAEERECAKAHGVYECEIYREWKPIGVTK